jgi:carboxyl-terminal processing protease
VLVGVTIGALSRDYVTTQTSLTGLNLSPVQKTYNELRKSYDGNLSDHVLIEGAQKGLVDAVGDPYTVFMNKKESEQFDQDLEGTFSGIGAELDKREGQLVIVAPLNDSPAQKAGLLPKDVIVKVNDEDTTKWTVDQAVSKIKGKAGTTVKLSIFRTDAIKDFTITRAVITTPSVTSEQQGEVGIVTISRFGETTATDTRQTIQKLKNNGIKKLLIDLRNNGGGYLDQANDIASLWVARGKTVVTERRGDKIIEDHTSTNEQIAASIPTVVLINSGSASASEIVAGALQDYKLATIVGEKSFGKGSVQSKVDLRGGATLKVTIAKWYTPNGKNISKHGVNPDQIIVQPESATRENDLQKQQAIDRLNSL